MKTALSAWHARWLRSEWHGRAFWIVVGCVVCQMGLGLAYVSRGLSADLIEALDMTRARFSGANVPQLTLQALASPLVGYLTVRFGARPVLAGSAVLFTLVFAGFSRVDSVTGFYLAIAGVGLGAAGMGDVTVGHVVAQWFRRHRGLALGLAYAGSNLGGSLMVWLTGAITARADFRTALLAAAAFSLVILLPAALFLVNDPPPGHALARADAREAEARLAGGATNADRSAGAALEPGERPSLDLRAALGTRTFWILTATLFAFFFYFNGILDHLVLILVDGGLSPTEAGRRLSQAIGLGIVSKIAGGWLADRVSQERAILYDFALLTLSSLMLFLLPDPVWVGAFIVTYGFSQAARDVVWPLAIERCFGPRHLASIYGAMTLVLLPGAALGPIVAALLRDRLGDYRVAFAIFVGLNAAALAALVFVRDERRPTSPG